MHGVTTKRDNHTLHKKCDVIEHHDNENSGYDTNKKYIFTYVHSACESINQLKSNKKDFFFLTDNLNIFKQDSVVRVLGP